MNRIWITEENYYNFFFLWLTMKTVEFNLCVLLRVVVGPKNFLKNKFEFKIDLDPFAN